MSIRFCLFAALCSAPAFADEPKADADGWIALFNGRDLTGWKFRNEKQAREWTAWDEAIPDPANPGKVVGRAAAGKPNPLPQRVLLCKVPNCDIYTEQEFGDYELHVEFMVPKGSNSGVYNRGLWEIQILDSFGKKTIGMGDCGSLYGRRIAAINAAKAPGEWQTFDITLKGYDITVVWNGEKVHEHYDVRWTELGPAEYEKLLEDRKAAEEKGLERANNAVAVATESYRTSAAGDEREKWAAALKKAQQRLKQLTDASAAKLEDRDGKHYKWAGDGPTTSGVGRKDTTKGPILLQGDHGDVAFRNIKIRPIK